MYPFVTNGLKNNRKSLLILGWGRRGIIVFIYRVPVCLSIRLNWVPLPPPPYVSPLGLKGGGATLACGWGVRVPNLDDWKENLALSILCGWGLQLSTFLNIKSRIKTSWKVHNKISCLMTFWEICFRNIPTPLSRRPVLGKACRPTAPFTSI
jgi:hypothetical protein